MFLCLANLKYTHAHIHSHRHMHTPPSRGLSGIFYLLSKWVPSTNPPIRFPFMFYRLINLTGFTCGIGHMPVCAHTQLWPCVHVCDWVLYAEGCVYDSACMCVHVPCCRDCMAAVGCSGTRPCLWRLRMCCCWSCCIWISCCWKANCLLPSCCMQGDGETVGRKS